MTEPAKTFTAEVKSQTTIVLFALGLAVVVLNSALYFFGVEWLSHPLISVGGVALLLPRYFDER